MNHTIQHALYTLTLNEQSNHLLIYRLLESDSTYTLNAPVFEINSQRVTIAISDIELYEEIKPLKNGCQEYTYQGTVHPLPGLMLQIVLRTAPDNPVVRFRYRLISSTSHTLTKVDGADAIRYTQLELNPQTQLTEISLSEFHEMTHSYTLVERPVPARAFTAGLAVPGPILVGNLVNCTWLMAFEHGSNIPNTYLQYKLSTTPPVDKKASIPKNALGVSLSAVKGNYYHKQILDPDHPFQSIWMQFAVINGDIDDMAAAYRAFVMDYLSIQQASRQPRIFYNTWNYQERNKHWNGQPYLASMNEERILAEIEVAHKIGVDVFVIDTGWYQKTGDWSVDLNRFPNGLINIREKLEEYGMNLGLWFNPTAAAITSHFHTAYRDCVEWRDDEESQPHSIWETEPSRRFCLVSRYADAFAEKLIQLNKELGVTYFKWDAVGQENGCSSVNHNHGGIDNTARERADRYEFELVQVLTSIAEKVNAACTDAIIDLDLTESGRSLGLSFLSVGKFFLINNGPYFANYDLPVPQTNENLLFYPGPARPTLCRESLVYDRWIPSNLFLTHYFPDETPEPSPHWSLPNGRADSLEVNLATLILGHNGIWGDLLNLSEQGIARIGNFIKAYKKVAHHITRAAPIRSGPVGSSPEIHEKLHQGRGMVVVFSPRQGHYTYVTQKHAGKPYWHSDGMSIENGHDGRVKISCEFHRPGAKVVFFE